MAPNVLYLLWCSLNALTTSIERTISLYMYNVNQCILHYTCTCIQHSYYDHHIIVMVLLLLLLLLDAPIEPTVTLVKAVGSTVLEVSWTYKGFVNNLKEYQIEYEVVRDNEIMIPGPS